MKVNGLITQAKCLQLRREKAERGDPAEEMEEQAEEEMAESVWGSSKGAKKRKMRRKGMQAQVKGDSGPKGRVG